MLRNTTFYRNTVFEANSAAISEILPGLVNVFQTVCGLGCPPPPECMLGCYCTPLSRAVSSSRSSPGGQFTRTRKLILFSTGTVRCTPCTGGNMYGGQCCRADRSRDILVGAGAGVKVRLRLHLRLNRRKS